MENTIQETVETQNGNDQSFDIDSKIGKFKNAEELLKAYNALEAEFTRRSQKICDLQNQIESKEENIENLQKEILEIQSNQVEKIENPEGSFFDAENVQEDTFKVEMFFEKIPMAKNFAKQIAGEILDDEQLKINHNGLEVALARVLIKSWKSPKELIDDEEFVNGIVLSNQKIKDAILMQYFDEIQKQKLPTMLSNTGSNAVIPPKRPKSIEEAGWLFGKK